MLKLWQFPILGVLTLSPLIGEEKAKFIWEPLEIRTSIFSQDLGMLGSERDEYATNLVIYAANQIIASDASIASLTQARRILALAMNLSPRNKQALVTQFQLGKGIIPEKATGDYSPAVLARLLLTRGQLLEKQADSENILLAHFFIQLAAEVDPRNEDAVYASELIRLDNGANDWEKLIKPAPKTETPEPEKE